MPPETIIVRLVVLRLLVISVGSTVSGGEVCTLAVTVTVMAGQDTPVASSTVTADVAVAVRSLAVTVAVEPEMLAVTAPAFALFIVYGAIPPMIVNFRDSLGTRLIVTPELQAIGITLVAALMTTCWTGKLLS
ncbi:hypothetical protein D5044_22495 [Verminephrobacter eiseniae]|nr:hypothetical protein [Verminephrobacter eiseniae]MCW5295591.1 hypothetical protein [Verminephrobacter eiseniae]